MTKATEIRDLHHSTSESETCEKGLCALPNHQETNLFLSNLRVEVVVSCSSNSGRLGERPTETSGRSEIRTSHPSRDPCTSGFLKDVKISSAAAVSQQPRDADRSPREHFRHPRREFPCPYQPLRTSLRGNHQYLARVLRQQLHTHRNHPLPSKVGLGDREYK